MAPVTKAAVSVSPGIGIAVVCEHARDWFIQRTQLVNPIEIIDGNGRTVLG